MWALGYGVEIWNRDGASVRVLPAPESAKSIFPNPAKVVLCKSSQLFLIGHVVIESLFLDKEENLTIEAAPGTSIIVRALSRRSRVRGGGEGKMSSPALGKEGPSFLPSKELSYLCRVSSFPADGTAARTGTYIYTGHALLPASACSEDDLHTYPLLGGDEEGLAEATRRNSGVHTPFQHCCCVHVASCVWDLEWC